MRLFSALSLAIAGCLALAGLYCAQAGAEDLPTHVVRAIRGGNEIEYLGVIEIGATQELDKVLSANPQATVLHLNSPGGEVTEAYRMVEAVRGRHLTTTVDKYCDSACTLVFLAGHQRLIAPDAKLGFHQPWIVGMSSDEIAAIDQRDRRYMEGLGIPSWFIDKSYATPNDSAWYPTISELTQAGVINGVSDRYVISVGEYLNTAETDEFAFSQFMEAAREHDPTGYQTLHQHLLKTLAQGNLSYSIAYDDVVLNYITAFMAHAEDRPVIAYITVFSETLYRLAEVAPDACFTALSGSTADSSQDLMSVIGPGESRKLGYAMLRAATNGAQNNLPIPSAAAVQAPLGSIWLDMHDKHPGELDALEHPQNANHTDYCNAHARIMASVLKLPQDAQASVARYLMAMDSRTNATATGSNSGSGNSSSAAMPSVSLHPHPDK